MWEEKSENEGGRERKREERQSRDGLDTKKEKQIPGYIQKREVEREGKRKKPKQKVIDIHR